MPDGSFYDYDDCSHSIASMTDAKAALGVEVYLGDCRDGMKAIADEAVDMVLTDPPYFIDGMGADWNATDLSIKTGKAKVIGGMPVGMKFDPEQGKRLYEFLAPVFAECMRILKPGGFLVSFSQARLYHRMAMAAEDAGFEIRDMLGWIYEGQAKAFSQDHFVRRMDIPDDEKNRIVKELAGRKTPQLKPMIEPMVLGQKPKDGTFVENWLAHGVGLVDTTQSLEPGKFPGNLMAVPKPGKGEKGANTHLTVKPVRLTDHLIRLFTKEGGLVVDPFMGSGTTAVSAIRTGRRCVGFEREPAYHAITQARIHSATKFRL